MVNDLLQEVGNKRGVHALMSNEMQKIFSNGAAKLSVVLKLWKLGAKPIEFNDACQPNSSDKRKLNNAAE